MTDEQRKKVSVGRKGKGLGKRPIETGRKISEKAIQRWSNPDFKDRMRIILSNAQKELHKRGYKTKLEIDRNIREKAIVKQRETIKKKVEKGEWAKWRIGQKHSIKSKSKMKETISNNHKNNPEYFKTICSKGGKISQERRKNTNFYKNHPVSNTQREQTRKTLRAKWNDVEFVKYMVYRMRNSILPTSYERRIGKIIKKNNLPYEYTGNGSFLIGFLNPDFVNTNGEKICIEVYHDYWKIKSFGSEEKYQTWRNKWLSKYGWNAIYLNDNDIKGTDEEIVKKIRR